MEKPSGRQAIEVLKFKAPLPGRPNEMPSYVYNVMHASTRNFKSTLYYI